MPLILGFCVHQTYHAGCAQDPDSLTTGNANGYISGQIFYDAFNVSTPSTLDNVP